jgi:hypothetical protein
MSQQVVNVGTVAGDGTGDRGQVPFQKTNANFTELYSPYVLSPAEQLASITAGQTLQGYNPGDIRRYGATLASSDNSAALALAVAQALQVGGSSIYIPGGTWKGVININGSVGGLHIRGDGQLRSVLVAPNTTSDLIAFGAGTTVFGVLIEGLQLTAAAGSTAGNGIHLPTGMSQPPFSMVFRDLFINGFGGRGIYDQAGAFTSYVENVSIQNTVYHNFDFLGGNSLSFRNCYGLGPVNTVLQFTGNVAATATGATLTAPWPYTTVTMPIIFLNGETHAAILTQGATTVSWTGGLATNSGSTAILGVASYRVHSGQPVFLTDNGINTGGAYWGLFSDNIAEDGTTNYCQPTLIGTNVESFGVCGIRNKQCGITLQKSTILAHAAGVIGLQIEPFNTAAAASSDSDGVVTSTIATIPVVFSAPPTGTSTALAAPWTFASGPWPVTFSDTEVRTVTLAYGATTASWSGALSGAPTANATTSSLKFGYGVHTALVSGAPFNKIDSPAGNAQFFYFDDVQGLAVGLTTDQIEAVLVGGTNTRYGKTFYDVIVQGALKTAYSGTQALAGVSTQAVTFATPLPTSVYKIQMTQSATSPLPPWSSGKAQNGFTINFSANYTGNVDWFVSL